MSDDMKHCDIFISGGGVAGLAAAAAFGRAGYSVVIVDPSPPVTSREDEDADLRTTAFLQPARDFLEAAGLWERLAPYATPLQVMRMVDLGTGPDAATTTKDFDAADISEAPFGWNLPNWLLRREMVAALAEMERVEFCPGVGFVSLVTRTRGARVRLSDGSALEAKLVIGADGRRSAVRACVDIDVRTSRYGQKALTFAVTHPTPHDNVSTEIHRSGGPFTLVPLPDHDGKPCSAVVWMEGSAEVTRLSTIPEDAFNAEATARSGGSYGALRLITRRTSWPIISQHAERLTAERVALVAEAAHVMPPIGAQGLNTSLKDLSCLLECVQGRDDPGDLEALDQYARKRGPDIRMRMAGIDMLNRASQADLPLAQRIRAAGIRALHDITPLRKTVMRLGLGARS